MCPGTSSASLSVEFSVEPKILSSTSIPASTTITTLPATPSTHYNSLTNPISPVPVISTCRYDYSTAPGLSLVSDFFACLIQRYFRLHSFNLFLYGLVVYPQLPFLASRSAHFHSHSIVWWVWVWWFERRGRVSVW